MSEDKSEYVVDSTIDVMTEIIFSIKDREIILLKDNGDIYIHGELAENNVEVVRAMEEFLVEATDYRESLDNMLFEKLRIAFKFGLKAREEHDLDEGCDDSYFDRAVMMIRRLYPKNKNK